MPDDDFKESLLQERQAFGRTLLAISLAMFALVLIVGLGVGIVVYNSVNNAPKIQCIYTFSKASLDDIHRIIHQDNNLKDYPDVVCHE